MRDGFTYAAMYPKAREQQQIHERRALASVVLVFASACALLSWQHVSEATDVAASHRSMARTANQTRNRRPDTEASSLNSSLPAALRMRMVSNAREGLGDVNATNTTATTGDDEPAAEVAADKAAADDIWIAWGGFVGLVTLVSFCCRPGRCQCRGLAIEKSPLEQYRPLSAHGGGSHA